MSACATECDVRNGAEQRIFCFPTKLIFLFPVLLLNWVNKFDDFHSSTLPQMEVCRQLTSADLAIPTYASAPLSNGKTDKFPN